MESNELASREQAGLLLRRIESRILFLKVHVRNAVTSLLESRVSHQSPHDLTLTASDLDRFAAHWTVLVPESFAVRAHLCRLLADKYLLSDATPRVQAALGAEFDQLKQAYLQIFGEPIETSFSKRNGASVPPPPR